MNRIFIFLFFFYSSNLFAQDLTNIKKAKPFKLSGSASVRGIYMNNGHALKGGTPLSYMLTGNPIISIYGIDIPFSFIWSPQAKEFQQPFNQYGASPSYKWATVHLGYRNISYNPFTLAGHTIYGLGFDINPGKWRIAYMQGRFASATAIDTISQSLQPINFFRKGKALKIGYGSEKSYFEFSALSASDDSSSIKTNLNILSNRYGKIIAPEGNFVTGLNIKIQLLKQISWDAQAAVSVYTRDLRNPSTIGDTSNNLLKQINKNLIFLNTSSEYYKALQSSLNFKSKNFGLKLRIVYIDPEYKSMGSYFINNDIQNITLMPSFTLFKKKMSISSSIGVQKDNLNGLKRTTSERIIGNFALNTMIGKKISLSTNYSNYSINQAPNISRIADTFRITQTTQNFSFTPIYLSTSKTKNTNIVLCVNYNTLNDFNTSYSLDYQNRTINSLSTIINYKITNLKTKLGFSFGLNMNNTKGKYINDANQGANIGLDKSNKNGKLNVSLSNTFLFGKRNTSNTYIYSSGLQASFKINKHHQFSFGNFLNNTLLKSSSSSQNITYFRSDISYTFIF